MNFIGKNYCKIKYYKKCYKRSKKIFIWSRSREELTIICNIFYNVIFLKNIFFWKVLQDKEIEVGKISKKEPSFFSIFSHKL